MYLETGRLIIRSIEPADEKAYVEIASDGSLDEDIFCGYQGEYSKQMHEWVTEAIVLDRANNPKKDYMSYTIVEKERGVVIGSVGCSYYDDTDQVGIVYFIGADYRGKGYAAEAALAYSKYFLEHYDIPKMVATIRTANAASCKTAEKAGFVLVETKMYKDYGDIEEKLYNFYEMVK
ncbi:MAG: GNAT family N-acetyltransferase [Lachnospiraceae bacterium]|nr:GNAT family N-acetyltransferase [Lachnospiraceae bacterium]